MYLTVSFPDETAFYSGMGIDLYENYPDVQKIYKILKIFAGYDLKKIIYGSEIDLSDNQKKIAVVVTSVAIFKKWKKAMKVEPNYYCGYGIGNISAMVCKGKLSLWYVVWLLKKGKTEKLFSKINHDVVIDVEKDNWSFIKNNDVIVDIGPSNTVNTDMIGNNILVYLDNLNDSSYLFDNITRKKYLNYFYGARRLTGVAVATQNYSNNPEDNSQLDSEYSKLSNIIDSESRTAYQDNFSFTKEKFRECAYILETILRLKKADSKEVSEQFSEIQSETGINMHEYFKDWI